MYIQNEFISRHINRSNRILLITALGIVLVLLLITYIFIIPIQKALDSRGIFPILILLILFIVPGLIIVLWILKKIIHRHVNPQEHPILKQLRSYGDTAIVASQIELEMNQSYQKISKVFFTSNWLIYKTLYTLNIVQLQDVVWLYQSTVHYRSRYHHSYDQNTYEAIVCDRQGRTINLSVRKDRINELMSTLYLKVPSWAITGYNDELKRMWQEQRHEMIVSVDNRRRIVQQSSRDR